MCVENNWIGTHVVVVASLVSSEWASWKLDHRQQAVGRQQLQESEQSELASAAEPYRATLVFIIIIIDGIREC